jgi:hypothetical protein
VRLFTTKVDYRQAEAMSNPESENSAESVEITIRVGDWQIIDATIDNSVDIAAEDGDHRVLHQGRRVRNAGWEAARIHPRSGEGLVGWPPTDDELSVTLPITAWRFILDELHRWGRVEAELEGSDQEKPESRSFAIARFLTERIAGSS